MVAIDLIFFFFCLLSFFSFFIFKGEQIFFLDCGPSLQTKVYSRPQTMRLVDHDRGVSVQVFSSSSGLYMMAMSVGEGSDGKVNAELLQERGLIIEGSDAGRDGATSGQGKDEGEKGYGGWTGRATMRRRGLEAKGGVVSRPKVKVMAVAMGLWVHKDWVGGDVEGRWRWLWRL